MSFCELCGRSFYLKDNLAASGIGLGSASTAPGARSAQRGKNTTAFAGKRRKSPEDEEVQRERGVSVTTDVASQRRLELIQRKLSPLGGPEAAALLDLTSTSRAIRSGQEIVSEGRRCRAISLITEGIAIRYRILRDGRRQILNFLFPGDFAGTLNCHFESALYSIKALSPVTMSPISLTRLSELFDSHPRVAIKLFWLSFRRSDHPRRAPDRARQALGARASRAFPPRTVHAIAGFGPGRSAVVSPAADPGNAQRRARAEHSLCKSSLAAASRRRIGDDQASGRDDPEFRGAVGFGRFRAQLSATAVVCRTARRGRRQVNAELS